ncbi:cytochrome P450 [Calycina marina]|uniref:Cytochrome P450 n=1 Tax=Calycina marina TaxID=1763456 RepID=A0A9P7YZV2_9HELO|nr:cytochrome P450 [Calycina marina]
MKVALLILCILSAVVPRGWRWYIERKQARKHNCKAPPSYPHWDLIFGLDALLKFFKAFWQHRLMIEINKTFDDIQGGVHTFSINFLGSTTIYTREPENVKSVFATNHKSYTIPQTRKDSLGIFGPGIFTSDGQHWEASRALLRPNFMRSQLDTRLIEVHVSALITKIPKDGSAIDLVELFSDLTMDIATELFLGESTHLLQGNRDPKALRFSEAFGFVSEKLSVKMGIGWLANVLPDRKFDDGVRDLKEFIGVYVKRALDLRCRISDEIVEKHETNDKRRYVFLTELAKSGYPQSRIAAELMNVITAGRGSITSILTVLWFTIARQPEVFKKLKHEVDVVLEGRLPTFEELKSLRYLGLTLKEIQRMYPVIPVNSRVAIVDTIIPLGGGLDGLSPVFIKKGTRVLHFPFAMHRRKDIFGADADNFIPERWADLRTSWEYLPFSGGPRTCLGQQMALTEASYTTVRMLQAFDNVEPGDDSVWAEKLVLAMSVESACCLKFARGK